jgi:hypothetical protein
VVKAPAPSQSRDYILVDSSTRWIQDPYYSLTSIFLSDGLDPILYTSKHNFILGIVCLGILHGLCAALNTNNLHITLLLEMVFYTYTNGSYSTAKVEHNVALRTQFNNLAVKSFTHFGVALEESATRYSEGISQYSFVVESVSPEHKWSLYWNAIRISVVSHEA